MPLLRVVNRKRRKARANLQGADLKGAWPPHVKALKAKRRRAVSPWGGRSPDGLNATLIEALGQRARLFFVGHHPGFP